MMVATYVSAVALVLAVYYLRKLYLAVRDIRLVLLFNQNLSAKPARIASTGASASKPVSSGIGTLKVCKRTGDSWKETGEVVREGSRRHKQFVATPGFALKLKGGALELGEQ